jgi:acetyl esterase/lipase
VRDMEFAWAVVGAEFNADRTRLAVLGHSLGGVEALMFAMRNGNVSPVVGLDGTYGFKGSTGVPTDSWGYDIRNMRAAFLDPRRAQGQQDADLDLVPVGSFRYADLTMVTMVGSDTVLRVPPLPRLSIDVPAGSAPCAVAGATAPIARSLQIGNLRAGVSGGR